VKGVRFATNILLTIFRVVLDNVICILMVAVAQLVEFRIVDPAVAGSSPVSHPLQEKGRFENRPFVLA
jgi:hypothetical protein